MNRRNHVAIVLVTFAFNFGLDRITKYLAERFLRGTDGIRLLFDAVVIRYVENSGAFLSLGAQWPKGIKYAVLLFIPILLCLYGLYHCLVKETDARRIAFLVCVIAGGLGNLVDRLFNDFRVVDFLNFGIGSIRTGILNVADLSIVFGAIGLILYENVRRRLAS